MVYRHRRAIFDYEQPLPQERWSDSHTFKVMLIVHGNCIPTLTWALTQNRWLDGIFFRMGIFQVMF